jgi:hypothetical protein
VADNHNKPTRITVSGGPKVEPRLYTHTHERWEAGDVITAAVLVLMVLIMAGFAFAIMSRLGS